MRLLIDGLLGLFVAIVVGRVAWGASFEGLALLLVLVTLIATLRRLPVAPPNSGLGFLLLVMGGVLGYFAFEEWAEPGSWAAYFRVAAGMTLGVSVHLVWWFAARPASKSGVPDSLTLNLALLGTALLLLTPEPAGTPAIQLGGSRLPLMVLVALSLALLASLVRWQGGWPWRRLLWVLLLVPLTFGVSQGLRSAQRPMLGALYGLMPDFDSPTSGFSPFQSLLSNAFITPSDKVVIRVQGEYLPSRYLVGSRHHHFDGKRMSWSSLDRPNQHLVTPDGTGFSVDYGVRSKGPDGALTIETLRDDDYLFLPPGSRSVTGNLTALKGDSSGALKASWLDEERHQVVAISGPGQPQPLFEGDLQLPEWWDPPLEAFAAQFSEGSRTDKVRAVANMFADRPYSLGTQLDRKRPFHDFLLNEKPAFCFWYASAGALLLRSQGVPTRLVSGYRVWESLAAGIWVVRERDAHSWVEWQDETGLWRLLDPTPPSLGVFLAEYRSSAANRFIHLWRLRLRDGWEGLEFSERFEQLVIGGGFIVLMVLFFREYRRIGRNKAGQVRRWGRLWQRFMASSGLTAQSATTAQALGRQLPVEWPEGKRVLCKQFLGLYQQYRFAATSSPPFAELENLLKQLRRSRF